MPSKLFYLQPGDLKRLLPFFALYTVVFAMLALGDAVSLSLFVHRVGATALPAYYGVTAVLNMGLMAAYMAVAPRLSSPRMFQLILVLSMASFLGAWAALRWLPDPPTWCYGLLFVSRELSFTMALMHFGSYLQDYFTRQELDRVLPIIYAGGRLGGALGGALLGALAATLGMLNFVLLYGVLALVCAAAVAVMARRLVMRGDVIDPQTASGGLADFRAFWRASPMLRWMSVSSAVFILCRWLLNYQYSHFFQTHFVSENAMGAFLGWYMTAALGISLGVQLLLVNRLVARFGVQACALGYAGVMALGMTLNLATPSLAVAVLSRFLETEFRTGFYNPLRMLVTNRFEAARRRQARAWTMGVMTPLGALTASALLGVGLAGAPLAAVAWLGALMGGVNWAVTARLMACVPAREA